MAVANLGNAFRIVQSGLEVVTERTQVSGNNLSRLRDPTASRQIAKEQSVVLGGAGAGVKISDVTRVDNSVAQRALLPQISDLGRIKEIAAKYKNIMSSLGGPGDNVQNALTQRFAEFERRLITCITRPNDVALRTQVIQAAQELTQTLNKMATKVQELRLEADLKIEGEIEKINQNLETIKTLNMDITQEYLRGKSAPTQKDMRDAAIAEIAERINMNPVDLDYNAVGVIVARNYSALDSIEHPLGHTAVGSMNPSMTLAGGSIAEITIGGVNIKSTDITSGSIKALMDLRDTTLPDIQECLDEISEKLRDQINAIHNKGTAYPAVNTLIGSRTFAAATDAFAGTGIVRIAITDQTGNLVNEIDILLPFSTDIQAIINTINGALGADATASFTAEGQLKIETTNPLNGIAISSEIIPNDPGVETSTGLGFSHYFGLNDLFVSSNIVYGSSRTGVSNIIDVRSDIKSHPTYLATAVFNTSATVGGPVPALTPGKSPVLKDMIACLQSNSLSFAAAGEFGVLTASFKDYSGNLLGKVSIDAEGSYDLCEARTEILTQLQKEDKDVKGINLEQEMGQLMLTQTQQSILVKALSIISEMMSVLQTLKK